MYGLNSNMNVDEARYNRNNRLNPPEFYPNQQANTNYANDMYGQSGQSGANQQAPSMDIKDFFGATDSTAKPVNNGGMGDSVAGDLFNTSLNAGASNNSLTPAQTMQTQQQQYHGVTPQQVAKVCKDTWKGFTDLIDAFKGAGVLYWRHVCSVASIISLVVVGIGFITMFFGYAKWIQLCISGVVCLLLGVPSFLLLSTFVDRDNIEEPVQGSEPTQPMQDFNSTQEFDNMSSFNSNPEPADDFFSFNSSDAEDDDDFEDDYEDKDDDEWNIDTDEPQGEEGMDKEESLNSLQEIPRGMYTRQYLFDAFTRVLPTINPNFASVVELDENSDDFILWDGLLEEACEAAGCKERAELNKVSQNLFTITVECTKPAGFKPDAVGDELAKLYAFEADIDDEEVKVFTKVKTVGVRCFFTIFNGTSAMVSVKDMMYKEKDYILDSRNTMPIIIGVDSAGKVYKYDFKRLESILVTGMTRSGKSWLVQCILAQMCMYLSPNELHFYICDPKDTISDFRSFALPHVKKFIAEDLKIIEMLRYLVRVEAPRRTNIIGTEDKVNIWDFKAQNPDIEMPVIYVVIDELVTISSRLHGMQDKSYEQEFRLLLRELITRLPALGIRAILVPHVIKNDIIEKKTSDLIPCRISVRGDAKHIEETTDARGKDFPYVLSRPGDMAVKISDMSQTVLFLKAPVLTPSNDENAAFFKYMRKVWEKLEPNVKSNEIALEADLKDSNKDLLALAQDDSEDIELFSNSSAKKESGYSSFVSDFEKNFL